VICKLRSAGRSGRRVTTESDHNGIRFGPNGSEPRRPAPQLDDGIRQFARILQAGGQRFEPA
jgi:hypothetical protein